MGGFDLSTGMGTRTGQKSTGWFQPNATHKFATHFIALDFRVCDVILRKTLGFDKLIKDSQVKIRWRIQRISRITGSL